MSFFFHFHFLRLDLKSQSRKLTTFADDHLLMVRQGLLQGTTGPWPKVSEGLCKGRYMQFIICSLWARHAEAVWPVRQKSLQRSVTRHRPLLMFHQTLAASLWWWIRQTTWRLADRGAASLWSDVFIDPGGGSWLEVCLCGSPLCLTGHRSSQVPFPAPSTLRAPASCCSRSLKSNLRACLSPGPAAIVPNPTHTKQMSGTLAGFSRRKL